MPVRVDPRRRTTTFRLGARDARCATAATSRSSPAGRSSSARSTPPTLLAARGIGARVLDMTTMRPLDIEAVVAAAAETGAIVTVEEHTVHGGLGGAVAEVVASECPVPMRLLGVPGVFAPTGSVEALFQRFGLTAGGIADAANVARREGRGVKVLAIDQGTSSTKARAGRRRRRDPRPRERRRSAARIRGRAGSSRTPRRSGSSVVSGDRRARTRRTRSRSPTSASPRSSGTRRRTSAR